VSTVAPDETALRVEIAHALRRWPSAGLAVAVVRDGSLEWFHGHGVADVAAGTPVTEDTVFRLGSIAKTFTAIAVMQLWERGLVDLDAPADGYLRAFRLVPAKASFRQATVRHLLTHTAGIPALRSLADLFRPTLGWGVREGRAVPPLAEYYKRGLRIEVEPGTKWVYGNHGFAALGQIVEDVSGEPFDRYLREHVFGPLGMEDSDLVRTERIRPRLTTGYSLGSRGLRPVADRETATAGASAVHSTTRDMARYVAALLDGGANDHGSVLEPGTLATMFEPHYRPDPRAPGMGLGFFVAEEDGHRTVEHHGILPGFLSEMVVAPDDGFGVLAFTNAGTLSGRGAPVPLVNALVRRLLGLASDAPPDVPPHAETWSDVCGWYAPERGALTNLPVTAMLGAGVEVVVHRGRLTMRGLTPVPPMGRGVRLHPDRDDPDVFGIDLSELGLGSMPAVFARDSANRVAALHFGPFSLRKRPDARNPRRWANGALAVGGAAALALHRRRRRRRRRSAAGTGR